MNCSYNPATLRYQTVLSFILCAFLAHPAPAQEGGIENLRETSRAFASVAQKVSPAVVSVQVERTVSAAAPTQFEGQLPFGEDFFRRFFGEPMPGNPRRNEPPAERRVLGQGSGFVFASDGGASDKTYIMTNNHVVENAELIRVIFQDGSEYEAEITGSDPQSDVAVLEISEEEGDDLPELPFADSSKLQVGEWVLALGNPFGLSHTLTVGVVSATGRTSLGITDYEDFIQTDAAINPGNSGGPLVNLNGAVVGINTAIFSQSGGYMGVGFAIPINLAALIADQLIEEGVVTRGYLGIVIQELTSDLAESFNLEDSRGVVVAQVYEDSPAAEAGLRVGDIIVEYNDQPVADVGRFRNRVSLTSPGSREQLIILRNGKRQEISVTIGKLGEETPVAGDPTRSTEELGLTVQTLTPTLSEQLGVEMEEGVVVTQVTPGSIAGRAGIQPGTVILEVNQTRVTNAPEFMQAIDKARDKEQVLMLTRYGNAQRFVVLNW